MINHPQVLIFTDGAYSRRRDIGAWGFIIQYLTFNKEHEEYELIKEASLSGRVISTTNNRMELQAAVEGLNYLKRSCYVEIISDSTYVVNTINKWITSFVKNQARLNHDIMLELHKAIQKHKLVQAKWVRGHSTDMRNQRVNELVQKTAGTWKG